MVHVIMSYAHTDESLRDELEKHLAGLSRQGVITTWHDRRIVPGEELHDRIGEQLDTAEIVLLLVSADFLASDYCYDVEMTRAMERHERGEAHVIPVILRPCDWHGAPFGKLMAVPRDGKPVVKHATLDDGFLEVARAIRQVAGEAGARAAAPAARQPVAGAGRAAAPGPRSSNLRVRKAFTDRDRHAFLGESFEFVSHYFENLPQYCYIAVLFCRDMQCGESGSGEGRAGMHGCRPLSAVEAEPMRGRKAMPAFPVSGGLVAAAIALALAASAQTARAQEQPDPEDTVYATGALPEDPAALAKRPQTRTFRAFLPERVDLSHRFPRARSQGKQGSCVGWAVGYAARSYYVSGPGGGRRLTADRITSPAYIYDSIRKPGAGCDAGSRISDAMTLLIKGSVSYAAYPYDWRRCRRPGPGTMARATRFSIARWLRVDTGRLDQVKAELAKGHPVVIGMVPNRAFHKLRGRRIWRAGPIDRRQSGHAVTVVGYTERGRYFTVVNSWGRRWGHRGFGRIGYGTFLRRVKYGFAMRLAAKPAPPKPKPPPVVAKIRLPAVSCGRLNIVKKNGKQVVTGFVGTKDDLARVRRAAAKAKARVAVALRPWPQCETLMTLAKPLAHARRPKIALPKRAYRAGETLSFGVRMAGFQGYLHVAYVQADGKVVNLVRSDPVTLKTRAARAELAFGDGREGRPKFTVSAPFGREMIVAIASRSPLFAGRRPLVETERAFLTALRRAIVARPDPTQPERVVSAAFVALETRQGE